MAKRKRDKRRTQDPQKPQTAPERKRPAKKRGSRWPLVVGAGAVIGVLLVIYQLRPERAAPPLPPAIAISSGAATGTNVVLVTLDTLRADRVGCYGYERVETPNIDALAAEGVRFSQAVSVVPMTLPAHASILTGDYPPTHGVRDNGMYQLAADRATLAERFQAEGYATAAFIGAFVLDRRFGLAQGFDVYDDQITAPPQSAGVDPLNPQRTGDVVTDAALAWLDERASADDARPFLAWVHLFDPHLPYSPPEPFRSKYAARPYDGEVAFTDQQVGRIVAKLRALGLHERTVVVVVGDHGEGLGDHGESTHSLLIYGATMRVPLIFWSPALIPGGTVIDDRIVAIVDIVPTLLDLVGLAPAPCDGISLLQAPDDTDRAVYLETLAPNLNHGWSPLYGLRRRDDKLIEAPTPEYFDLRADPGENKNLWAERRDEVQELAERLSAQMDAFAAAATGDAAKIELDPEAIRKLESLGYIGSGGGGGSDEGPLPDPKEMVALSDQRLQQANALLAARRAAEAISIVRELLSLTPEDSSLWSLLSTAYTQTGALDEAINSRLRAIEHQPRDANGWVALGNLQAVKGDLAASQVSLAEAERLEPDLGAIYVGRALQAMAAGRYEEALAQCQEAARRDPTRYTKQSWQLRAQIYGKMGKPEEAAAALERAHGSP